MTIATAGPAGLDSVRQRTRATSTATVTSNGTAPHPADDEIDSESVSGENGETRAKRTYGRTPDGTGTLVIPPSFLQIKTGLEDADRVPLPCSLRRPRDPRHGLAAPRPPGTQEPLRCPGSRHPRPPRLGRICPALEPQTPRLRPHLPFLASLVQRGDRLSADRPVQLQAHGDVG